MPGPAAIARPPSRAAVATAARPAVSAKAPADGTDPALKSACDGMEALFISHMLSEMRKTVPKSGFLDGGHAEEIYTSLMDAELANKMAGAGGLGLSSVLLEQLGRSGGSVPGKPPRP